MAMLTCSAAGPAGCAGPERGDGPAGSTGVPAGAGPLTTRADVPAEGRRFHVAVAGDPTRALASGDHTGLIVADGSGADGSGADGSGADRRLDLVVQHVRDDVVEIRTGAPDAAGRRACLSAGLGTPTQTARLKLATCRDGSADQRFTVVSHGRHNGGQPVFRISGGPYGDKYAFVGAAGRAMFVEAADSEITDWVFVDRGPDTSVSAS